MPLRQHEHILIFAKGRHTYNPQKTIGKPYVSKRRRADLNYGRVRDNNRIALTDGRRFPTSIISIGSTTYQNVHPTQKPVALLEYLIKTYTNDGDTILDPTAGSGTTCIAAMNVGNRKVIAIEKDKNYYDIMCKRVAEHRKALG